MTPTPEAKKRVGIAVECKVCRMTKQPRGRSAPIGHTMCNPRGLNNQYGGCEGYWQEPLVGDLWPRETEMDWGYRFTLDGTREMTDAEVAEWKAEHE